MAKKNIRKTGRRTLAILLTLVMITSMVNVFALASGTAADPYDVGDVAYTADRNTQPAGEIAAGTKWQFVKTHDEVWNCGKKEHEHYFGCGSTLGICDGEHNHEADGCTVTEAAKAEWKLVADTSSDKAEHLDIHINLTAKYTVGGKTYDTSVILTGADYTSGRLTITSTGNVHNITRHGDSVDAGQYRFHGTFPVGTSTNPVNYTINLEKDVVFNVEGETVTVPMTFSKTVNYWTENICESLTATNGYKNGKWAAGEFVGGHMDFKLGASEATGTTNPVDPEPTEPAKYTVTVQKNVDGIDLDTAKAYSFGIYSGNDKIDTIEVTVPAGGTTAIGTIALEENVTYFVVEEGNPAIEGHELTTTSAVGTASAKSGITSDSFTVTGDTSVVFTNSYKAKEVTPPEPPAPTTYTLVTNWVDEAGAVLAASTTETKNEGDAYATVEKTFEDYELKEVTGDAVSGTMDGNKEVTYVYKAKEVTPPEPPTPPEPVTYTLVTNWVDEAGAVLAASTTETKDEGDAYATVEKTFEDYELKEVTGDAVSGTMDGDKEVTYVYKAKEVTPPEPPVPTTYTLVTNWVDEAGTALAASTTETKNDGDTYTTEQKSFEGYELKEITGDAANGTMDGNKEVTYVYKAKEVTPPPVEPPVNPPVVITYYYDLTVRYVDEAGVAIADGYFEENIRQNTPYTTEKLDIEGYEFKEMALGSDPVSGIMNTDKVVTYVYRQAEELVDIPDDDVPLDDEPIDIPDEDVPLADIPEEDVPLADVPETGDNGIALYIAMTILSAIGLAWLTVTGRKAKDN